MSLLLGSLICGGSLQTLKNIPSASYLNHINYKQLKVDKRHMNMSTTWSLRAQFS